MIRDALIMLLLAVGLAGPAQGEPRGEPLAAREERLVQLFGALAAAGPGEYPVIEQEIRAIWAESGSPALNLLLERGNLALEAGDWPAAIEHFTAAIDHAPDFVAAWNGRATAYFSAGLYGPALADIAAVLRLEPRHFGALTGLGVILEETGKRELARKAYRRVLALSPNRADVIEAIEALERAMGQFDS